MAKIDLKNATIKLWDGTLGTLTTTAAAGVDAQLVLTAKSKHHCSNKVSITLIDPGADNSEVIGVVVTGNAIVVTLGVDSGPAITTTGTLLAAALTNSAAALALLTIAQAGTGADLVSAQAITELDGQLSIEIKIGEGTLSYSEKTPREFVKDRGNLDTVRNADEEPMDVSFDFVWDFITSESGGTATVEEALRNNGEAAAWVTTASDVCQPYCIGLEIVNAPACASVNDEYTMFEEFYQEQLYHDAKEGSVNCAGRCNRTVASHYRVA